MPDYQPISREKHKNMKWQRYSSYSFVSSQAFAPIVAGEYARVGAAMPIAFLARGESFTPVALLGLEMNQNLFVSSEGRWLGNYVPAAFRTYPFALARGNEDRGVLCVDMNSELVSDSQEQGESFFDHQGQISTPLKKVIDFLQQIGANQSLTETSCTSLSKHGIIKPWLITLKTPAGEKSVEGIFRIDEQILNKITSEVLLELRDSGALSLAYTQLVSMYNINILRRLAEIKAKNEDSTLSELRDVLSLNEGML